MGSEPLSPEGFIRSRRDPPPPFLLCFDLGYVEYDCAIVAHHNHT